MSHQKEISMKEIIEIQNHKTEEKNEGEKKSVDLKQLNGTKMETSVKLAVNSNGNGAPVINMELLLISNKITNPSASQINGEPSLISFIIADIKKY